jgi:hypothetical protein
MNFILAIHTHNPHKTRGWGKISSTIKQTNKTTKASPKNETHTHTHCS